MKLQGFVIKHQINRLSFAVVLFLLFSLPLYATNWYVDKNATGSNNGTTWTNAWTNVSSIAWASLSAGDTVFVSGGTYTGQLAPSGAKSGTKNKYIVIISAKYAYHSSGMSGHTGNVILTGGIYINESGSNAPSYIKFKGFEVTGQNINMDVDSPAISRGLIFESIYLHDYGSQFGFRVISYQDSLIVDSCTVIDCTDPSGSCGGERDCMHFNYDGNTYARNTIIRNSWMENRSQDPTAHNDVIQSATADGFTIYNNILISDSVYSTEGGGMPLILSSNDIDQNHKPPVIIFNNFCYMGGIWYPNANYGKTLNTRHDGNSSANYQSPTYIFNNTLLSNGPRNSIIEQEYHIDFLSNNILASFCLPDGIGGESWRTGSTHGWHTNLSANDAYGKHLYRDSTRSNLFWREDNDQNLFDGSFYTTGTSTFTPSNWSQWISNGGTGLNADPKFVDNFGHEPSQSALTGEITSSSPAIGAGEDLTYLANYLAAKYNLPDDIKQAMLKGKEGNNRGTAWDIGAYQFFGGPDLTPPRLTSATLSDSVTLVLNFSETLDQATAKDKNNYSINNNISISNASLSGTKVILQTSPHTSGSYVITVANVKDLAGNSVDPAHNTVQYEYTVLPSATLMMLPVQNVEGITVESNHTPDKTIDGKGALSGDPDSRWAAEPMPEALTYDLGAIRTVSETKLSFYNWDAGRVYDFSISISIDHNNWTTVVSQATSASNEEWTVNEFQPVNARYVRVQFINNNQSTWAGLWEAQILGTNATVVDPSNNNLPNGFALGQNYPNPFNPSTTIKYEIPNNGLVKLNVYNLLGEVVSTLVNEEKPAGSYQVQFDASRLASGTYFYKLQVGSLVQVKKMILIK